MFKYTALIIEPRRHNAFRFVIHNILENLSEEWGILVFHGNQNQEFVYDIMYNVEERHRGRIIHLINMNVENLDAQSYSNMFFEYAFYDLIPTDTFLVFQTDSIILKENKDRINEFLDYDYVGAPWNHYIRGIGGCVGNGGFSLRKKSKMLEILESKGIPDCVCNEDVYFSKDVNANIQYKVPSFELAKTFSVETVFCENPFGLHNCWKYLSLEERDYLINKYPEIQILMELNAP